MLISQCLTQTLSENFHKQEMGTDADTTTRYYAESKTLEYIALNGMSLSNPFPSELKELLGRGGRKRMSRGDRGYQKEKTI